MKNALCVAVVMMFLILSPGERVAAVEHERGGGMQKHMECMKMGKHGGHHGMRHGGMHGYAGTVIEHAEALKLTDEQMGKILRIATRQQKDRRALMERMHKSMMDARHGLKDPAADETSIREAAKAHAESFDRMVEDALKARAEVNEVLSAEQREQLKGLVQGRMQRGHERHPPGN